MGYGARGRILGWSLAITIAAFVLFFSAVPVEWLGVAVGLFLVAVAVEGVLILYHVSGLIDWSTSRLDFDEAYNDEIRDLDGPTAPGVSLSTEEFLQATDAGSGSGAPSGTQKVAPSDGEPSAPED